jgi:hypothetical protein
MEDILFSRTLFLIGPTDGFVSGPILGIESINLFLLQTYYRELIIIS